MALPRPVLSRALPADLPSALARLAVAETDTILVLVGADGRMRWASPRALTRLGYDDDHDVEGLHWDRFLHSADPVDPADLVRSGGGRVRLRTAGGRSRWADVSVVGGVQGDQDDLLVVARDVTGEHLSAQATAAVGAGSLVKAVRRVALVLAAALDFDELVLLEVEDDGVRLLASSGPDDRAVGTSWPRQGRLVRELSRAGWLVVPDVTDPGAGDPRVQSEQTAGYASAMVRVAGQDVGVLAVMSGQAGALDEDSARLLTEVAPSVGVALLLLAQLEREQATATALLERTTALLARATSDPLTGLANRSHLLEALDAALAGAEPTGGTAGGQVGVLFCDLDRFKVVNDALGHHVGDVLLQRVADRLRQALPPDGLAARLGGDEFVVLVQGCTTDGLLALGRSLQSVVAEPVVVDHHRLRVGLSVGAVLAGAGDTAAVVLQHADTAMYRAKNGGRQRVALWTEAVGAAARTRFELERDLGLLLSGDPTAGRLSVLLQPVVDLRTASWTGLETLARWTHPEHGSVPPQTFVPLAEEVGLSGRLTSAVAAQAAAAWSGWAEEASAIDLRLGINISGRDLVDDALLLTLDAQLRAAGLAPEQLMLEVTETALSAAGEDAVAALHRLRSEGMELALDDFGTGFSSLAHLRTLPVTTIKVDRSFVSGEGDAEDPQAGLSDPGLVAAFAALAGSLGLTAVAEGVETEVQAEALRALGIPRAQGWLVGRPLSAEQVAAALAGRAR